MEFTFNSHIEKTPFTNVEISYTDLMYASQKMTPTSFRIYLYIIGHPNREVTRDELLKYFGVDNKCLYTARKEMTQYGFGSVSGSTYTAYNTCWGEDKEYVPKWM